MQKKWYNSPSARNKNIYHILYDILFEIHRHKPFNQWFFLFVCVDNTFITVLMLRIIFFVLFIMICLVSQWLRYRRKWRYVWWKALIFLDFKVFLSWFGIASFLGGYIASVFFLSFLECVFLVLHLLFFLMLIRN